MNVFHDGFQILVPGTVTQSDRVNVHAFCSPDYPFSGALGPAEKFENQQEFLPTRHTSPTRQITTEEGEGTSHVGNLGGFRTKIIPDKGNRSFLYDKIVGSLLELEIFGFVPCRFLLFYSIWNLYHRVRI